MVLIKVTIKDSMPLHVISPVVCVRHTTGSILARIILLIMLGRQTDSSYGS